MVIAVLVSCKDFEEGNEDTAKILKKQEEVFQALSKKWTFVFPSSKPETTKIISEWNEWQQFKRELEVKPKTSILAFQSKVKTISKKTDSLRFTVPEPFNIPQVKSRLITLNTKIKSMETFINLEEIPKQRILKLVTEINEEIKGVYVQCDEVIIKREIPKEIGEEEMIRALDTSRLARKKFQEKIENQESNNKQ